MKLLVLALLLTCGTVASEAVAASPATTATTISATRPRGIWGIFKGKKHKKRRPAYSRLK